MHFWIGTNIRKHFVWSPSAEPLTRLVWKDKFHVALELTSQLLDFIVLNMEVCETRKTVWIRNQLDVTFVLSFISPLQVAQHVSGNHVPIFRN